MNTVIFLTKDNKADMESTILRLTARQNTKVNGALIIAHQSAISSYDAQKIAAPLVPKFQTASAVTSAANLSLPHDSQLAAIFARFSMLAYSRFPGPWLIIDGPCTPLKDDWAQETLRLHNTHGGKSCGLARQDGKTLLSYGPTTLQLQWQTMKMFRFATNESWRSRGRYLLAGAGFRQIQPEDRVFDVGPAEEEASKDEATKEEDGDESRREELMAKIENATGKRPHHFTGIDKLVKMAQDLDQPTHA